MNRRLERGFFLGFVRVHILHHACEAPIYGTEMVSELARHGYALSYGTLYPVLHTLENEGLLKSERRGVSGKLRRYYVATAAGRQVLADAKSRIGELVSEVLGDGPDAARRRPPKATGAGGGGRASRSRRARRGNRHS